MRAWIGDLALLIAYGAICAGAFAPAQHRFFAADQIGYFAEVNGERSAGNLVRFWDYGDVRQYNKGDEVLFRPLLFAWLGMEYDVFTYHPLGWNLANLAVHIAVVFLLYKLLWLISPGPVAAAGAALFAVLNCNVELVVWNHLGGYLLAYAFLLGSLIAARKIVGGNADKSWMIVFFVCGLIASLFYEIAGVFVFFAGVYVLARRRREGPAGWKLYCACLGPAIIFVVLDAAHLPLAEHLFAVDHSRGFAPLTPRGFVAKIMKLVGNWIHGAALPLDFKYAIDPERRFFKLGIGQNIVLEIVLAVCAAGAVALGIRRRRPAWGWAGLMGGMILVFAGIVCIGRGETDLLHMTTYYSYLFTLLALPLVFGLLQFQEMGKKTQWLVAGVVLVLAGVHFSLTRQTCEEIAWNERFCRGYFQRVTDFVDAHRGEPGFSFSIADPPPDVDGMYSLPRGYPWEARVIERKSVAEIIYAPYFDAAHPKYVLDRGYFKGE